ncbi:hypothetical protein ABW20_dc0103033 [Dactylellina cionopaga]|nr:hypothetical protein ABW20_dc0103033 [Dactylellina cionopaga]
MKELGDIARGYEDYIRTGTSPELLDHPQESYNPRYLSRYLLDDYLGIRKIALSQQYSIRVSRREPPLTLTEVRRIIQAIYRGWTLLLLLYQREWLFGTETPTTADKFDKGFIERLISTWDIWSVFQIREIAGESLTTLPTGAIDLKNTKVLQQWNDDLENSLLQPLLNSYCNWRPVTFLFPLVRPIGMRPTEANLALSQEFSDDPNPESSL